MSRLAVLHEGSLPLGSATGRTATRRISMRDAPAPYPRDPDAPYRHPPSPGPSRPNVGRRRAKPRRRLPPEVLDDHEVRALLAACGPVAPTELRNRALIAILYRGGLRIAESLDLYPKDLNRRTGEVRVLRGKGGLWRTSAIDPGGMAIVERWLEARSALGLNGTSPLLCSLHRNRLTEGYVRRLLPRLARKAGVEKRVHAHGLRHTHAAQLRAEGVDLLVISRQLGHRNIITTARYLDHLAPRAVVEAIGAREW